MLGSTLKNSLFLSENKCFIYFNLFRKYGTTRIPSRSKQKSGYRVGIDGFAMLTIPVVTFCLGTWQVYRRQWKLNLIKALEEKTTSEPIDLPLDLDELYDLEYRKVRVTGQFDNSKEVYVHPRSLLVNGEETGGGLISSGQTGAHVITPFKLSDRELTILVNRGWVPRRKTNPESRSAGQVEGEVELVGVVRHNEPRAPFVPKHQEGTRFLHYRDVEKIAEMCDASPVFLDADSSSTVSDGPKGGQTRVSLRNEHMSYIFTWYSLCVATTFLWFKKFVFLK